MLQDHILLDVETQRDFFMPGGSCYQARFAPATQQVYRLFEWARREDIPVISTVLRVRPNEHGPLAPVPHCVDGTDGEKKLPRTILPRRVNLGLLNTTDLPSAIFAKFQQVIFEKRDTDIFAHARAERLISELPHVTFVVCGAGVAHSIVQAVVGLRSRGFSVVVVSDAILDLDDPMADMARRRMEAKGALFVPTAEVTAPRPQPRPKPFRVMPAIEAAESVVDTDDEEDEEIVPRRARK